MATKTKTKWGEFRDTQRQKLYNFEQQHIMDLFPREIKTVRRRKPMRVLSLCDPQERAEREAEGYEFLRMTEGGRCLMQRIETHRKKAVPLSLDHCGLLVDWCLATVGMDPERYRPVLKDGRRNRKASANEWELTLPLWARSVPVTIHEAAHTITRRHKASCAGHGPEYCRVYFHLIAQARQMPEFEAILVRQAKDAGLKVAPATYLKELRSYYKGR